ncbi:multidrug ABC transporter ATP-binding protein [Aureimonas endophytica]|uniref:Multidrug ABC transporter ATP-binding protein n=1 Tax=Aureimonas endophytica TaxID=2027858 RepID=A0A917E2F7_9HYPH|nr:ABC transporter ATP-binding protein [Aureimonas endophytica]GGD93052.1 multidrug ABC transporter ATP-binding protein [Aureimonas endophytica]
MSDSNDTKRGDALRAVLRFTFANWREHRLLAFAIGGAICLATLVDILVPIFAGRIIDALAPSGAGLGAAWDALGAMAALGLLFVVCRHVAFIAISVFTLRIMRRVGARAFARVQHFSADWHANAFSGSTVRQITRGMWALDLMHDTLLVALLPSVFVLLGTVALFAWRWPAMGLVLGLGAIAYLLLTVLLTVRWVAVAARESNRQDTRVGGVLADALSCNAVVKAFGAEDREEARLDEALGTWKARTWTTWRRGSWSGTLQTALLWAIRFAITAVALLLWSRGQASPGDVVYVLTTYFVIHGYLRDIGFHVMNLQRSANDMEELVALDAEMPAIRDAPDARPLAVTRGEIRFEAVTFRYGNHRTPLYEGLSVVIAGGQSVGLVGHSGSGKTTFVKLLQRLYEVTEGGILIDGQDVRGVTQRSLRRQVAIVPQESILFHRSLAENIAYGRPGAGREEIERAARLASADRFIERLPQGYETLVGERGVKLSGGERQRVALARAFLADAPILILDEATSSLDSESEAAIQEATERLMKGRTSLVIAHRLSTVRALDRILVFDRGRIVEDGDHQSLLRQPNGHYRRLSERQSVSIIAAE